MKITFNIDGFARSFEAKSLTSLALNNKAMGKDEFIGYLICIANDYWAEAEEHEDESPASMPYETRIDDFAVYLKIYLSEGHQ